MKPGNRMTHALLTAALAGLLLPTAALAGHYGGMRPMPGYQHGYGRPMMAPMPGYGRAYGRGYRPPMRGYGAPQPTYPGRSTAAASAQATPAAGQTSTSKSAEASGETVNISQMRFDPPNLSIATGETVTWRMNDGVPHTVTAEDGSFSSRTLSRGGRFSHTFDQPGTYEYVCSIHPSMRGRITVE